ncbi:hypothetical protein AVEN_64125-1 [Araneus ventricosus]|uniref:Uncharacterized protein n=1 Tax=Araneus ventricosus TaxID=182803 RepID=A0A4Y2C3S8_ARAVE|nr:hypothetical protein AVEN_64125-1 [Araneus ventricosus]
MVGSIVSCVTQQLIESFVWEQMIHTSYRLDLEPSNFLLFLHLKRLLSDQHFDDDEEVKDVLTSWLTSQAATLYDAGIQNLISRYSKFLNVLGNYFEK